MKVETINEKFIQAVKEKIPQKTTVATRLAEILDIEKEAVYRRLRGEVNFSFAEVATISPQLGISLDNIIGSIEEKSKPFILKLADFINPNQEDYQFAEYMTNYSDSLKDYSETEYGAAMNMIPLTLSVKYEMILHFYVYKWFYQNFTPTNVRCFKDIKPDPGMVERIKMLPYISGKAKNIFYIWEESIFQNVVKDISYFNAVNLISDEEKELLKKDLLKLLDEIEQLAIRGKNEFGNNVHIYVSNVSFETSYSYVESPHLYLTMIMTFTMNQVISIDPVTFNRIKQFMQSLKRTSTLISESGEMYRIRFFQTQRDIVNTL